MIVNVFTFLPVERRFIQILASILAIYDGGVLAGYTLKMLRL